MQNRVGSPRSPTTGGDRRNGAADVSVPAIDDNARVPDDVSVAPLVRGASEVGCGTASDLGSNYACFPSRVVGNVIDPGEVVRSPSGTSASGDRGPEIGVGRLEYSDFNRTPPVDYENSSEEDDAPPEQDNQTGTTDSIETDQLIDYASTVALSRIKDEAEAAGDVLDASLVRGASEAGSGSASDPGSNYALFPSRVGGNVIDLGNVVRSPSGFSTPDDRGPKTVAGSFEISPRYLGYRQVTEEVSFKNKQALSDPNTPTDSTHPVNTSEYRGVSDQRDEDRRKDIIIKQESMDSTPPVDTSKEAGVRPDVSHQRDQAIPKTKTEDTEKARREVAVVLESIMQVLVDNEVPEVEQQAKVSADGTQQMSKVLVGDNEVPKVEQQVNVSADETHETQQKTPTELAEESMRIQELEKKAAESAALSKQLDDEWNDTRVWVRECLDSLTDSQLAEVDVAALTRFLELPGDSRIYVRAFEIEPRQLRFFRRKQWLSDTDVEQSLRYLASSGPRSFEIVNSINLAVPEAMTVQKYIAPSIANGRTIGLLVGIYNFRHYHWTCIVFDFKNNKRILFDPLQQRAVYSELAKICKSAFAPLLVGTYAGMREENFTDYKQQDGYNCGLYVLEFIRHYVSDKLDSLDSSSSSHEEYQNTQFLRVMYLSKIFSISTIPDESNTQTGAVIKKRRRRSRKPSHKKGDLVEPITLESTTDSDIVKPKSKLIIESSSPSPPSSPSPSPIMSPKPPPPPSPISISAVSQPIPVTPLSVDPYPIVNEIQMSSASMSNEMIAFIKIHQDVGVTLPLVSAYFANHIDASNRKDFLDIFQSLTHQVGDKFFLKSVSSPLKRKAEDDGNNSSAKLKKITGTQKVHKTPQQLAPEDHVDQQINSPQQLTPAKEADAGVAIPVDNEETRKRKNPPSSENDSGSATKSPKKSSSSSPSSSSSSESTDSSATDTDQETSARRQLREKLTDVLKRSSTGMSLSVIQRKVTGSKKDIQAILPSIATEKNRKWFLKVVRIINTPVHGNKVIDRDLFTKDIWTPKPKKRLKQKSVEEYESKMLPAGYAVVEDIVDIEMKNKKPIYHVVFEAVNGVRPPGKPLRKKDFYDINKFRDKIECLVKWKKSGMTRSDYFTKHPAARPFLEVRKNISADGDKGWCSFRAVGVALELLTKRMVVSTKTIRDFRAQGAKIMKKHKREPLPATAEVSTEEITKVLESWGIKGNQPEEIDKDTDKENSTDDDEDIKYGAKWPEVLYFTRMICSKKVGHDIPLDFNELSKNLSQGGKSIDALKKLNLGPGVYLVAGFYANMSCGHCVVLEVLDDRVFVHEDDMIGGPENLNWLHQLSYVRRVKLMDENSVPEKKKSKKKKKTQDGNGSQVGVGA